MGTRKIIPIACVVAGLILAGLAAITEGDGREGITKLERPTVGAPEKEYEFNFSYDGIENSIKVPIGERRLEFAEAQEFFEKSFSEIVKIVEDKNGELSNVTDDLVLPGTVFDGVINVTWRSKDRKYIGDDGGLNRDGCKEIGDAGQVVVMVASVTLQDYEAEFEIPVCISPDVFTETERKTNLVFEAIEQAENAFLQEDYIDLPFEIAGNEVTYYSLKEGGWWKYIVLGVMAAMVFILTQKQKELNHEKARNKELQLAFAPIITKLTLLIGAGISIRGAWEKVVNDYKRETKKNVAYEEMLKVYNEMQNGFSEGQAYVLFGKRCRLSSYVKLGNLLEQNLRKGTKGLSDRLEYEVWEAFEDRKALAYRLGDEAGTKLLVPMIMSFGIIIVFCVVPAFLNM